MGVGLLGGAVGTVLVSSFKAIDEQVGTNGSAAAAVLGIALIIAAVNPSGSVAWVRIGILYGLVAVVFEVANVVVAHKPFHLGPVIFGLAFTLLLIAAYPERRKLLRDATPPKAAPSVTDEPPAAIETAEPEKA